MTTVFSLLDPRTVALMKEGGVAEPTEIQTAAIPAILRGENVLVISSTGMGKTEATLLPIFQKMLASEEKTPIVALYVTPLRALNRDIFRRMVGFGEQLGIQVAIRHGDTSQSERRRQVRDPPHLLITTPETLGIILNVRSFRPHLKNVRHLVVDEYHELVESKRGVQLSLVLERLKRRVQHPIQMIGLSATVGDPQTTLSALLGSTSEGRVVEAAPEREFDASITYLPRDREGVSRTEAETALVDYVRRTGKTLVFTNTRGQAEALSLRMRMEAPEIRLGTHHGSLSASIREEVEDAFNRDELDVLVCTSSMELGVDIQGVRSVVQWTSPRKVTKLAQRIGRSEHKPGLSARGAVVSRTVDDFFESLSIIKLLRDGRIEKPILHRNSLDVLAHQAVGMALNEQGIGVDEVYGIVKGSHFYRDLALEELEDVLRFLDELGLVSFRGGKVYSRRGSIRYFFENVSTIPEVVSYRMRDVLERKYVATLDEDFVGEHCDKASKILVNGRTWRVVKVDEEEMRVSVAPDTFDVGVIPQWVGEMMLVDRVVAELAGGLQTSWVDAEAISEETIDEEIHGGEWLDEIRGAVGDLVETHGRLPGVENVTVSWKTGEGGNLLILHAFWGDRVNETMAQLVKTLVKSLTGVELAYASSPYRVVFLDRTRTVTAENVVEAVRKVAEFRENAEDILATEAVRQGKFLWVFWNVCKRMGAAMRGTRYRRKLVRGLYFYLKEKPPVKEALNEVFTRYYDVEGTTLLLEGVAGGRIELFAMVLPEWTRLEMEYFLGNETPAYREFIEDKEALELLKRRVMKSRVYLVCLNCGKHMGPYTLSNLTEERLRCLRCRGRMLGRFIPMEEHWKIVDKIGKRKKLSDQERKEMQRMRDSARLLAGFGLPALYCLQAYGVGVQTAKRILRHGYRDTDDLFTRILQAERKYFETRMYWKEGKG